MEAGAPQPQSRALVYLMLALAVLSWAGNWVIGRALRFDAPPVALTFWRWALAFALLAPFTWRRIVAQRDIVLRSWKIIVVLGLLATVSSISRSTSGCATPPRRTARCSMRRRRFSSCCCPRR